jgi:hypothetical protein
MLQETTEVQELSLEKVIETRLVQGNVTERVLAELKEKYGSLKLKSIDDKESYLELKAAAKDCAKVRNLAVKVCKEGREDAVRQQKLWIAKEKEVVARVSEVEAPLDAEISRFDAEVKRKEDEEKSRKEEAYINRQAALTKMGATYSNGCFVLGNASFEANLIKDSSEDVWEEAVLPKFRSEYEIVEAERAAEEKRKEEERAELRRQQEELQRQQEEFRKQQAALEAQKQEAERKADAERRELMKSRGMQLEALGMRFSFQYDAYVYEDVNVDNKTEISLLSNPEWDALLGKIKPVIEERKAAALKREEEKRQKEIEAARAEAIRQEQERAAEEARQAEIKRQQEEVRKAEEMAQANDREKYNHLINQISAINIPDMKSGQYRKKAGFIREKISEILAL